MDEKLVVALAELKKQEEEKRKAENMVHVLNEDLLLLKKARNYAIQHELDVQESYLNNLANLSKDMPISAISYARELVKFAKPDKVSEIEKDESFKIESCHTTLQISTDISIEEGPFEVKSLSYGNFEFTHSTKEVALKRKALVISNLKKKIANNEWDGITDSFMFALGKTGYIQIFANLDFKKNPELLDLIDSISYDFTPTVANGRAYFNIEVSLHFKDLSDLTIYLDADTFSCLSEDEKRIVVNDNASNAFFNILTKDME